MKCLVGSTKGLIIYNFDGIKWTLTSVEFAGLSISMIHYDRQRDEYWVGLSMKHWGPKLFRSGPSLRGWREVRAPEYPEGAEVRAGKMATSRLIWSGLVQSDGSLWIGTEPGGLFHSQNEGQSWELNRALWDHPTREKHWFGGGRDEAGIHAILSFTDDPGRLLVGVSCGGVYQTEDGGHSWSVCNAGLKADYLPNPSGPYGHDPHSIKPCLAHPNVLWQQNHCGVFLSRDGGKNWNEVTPEDGYGQYGFPIVAHKSDPDTAWIIPAESDDCRVAKDGRLVVCKTEDGGVTWQKCTHGLPQKDCFDLVFRHAFDRRDTMMVFGTTTGNLFFSNNEGDFWQIINSSLPPVHSVLLID